MPNKAINLEIPYYYDFDGANNTYLQFHVDTVFRQADDLTNKQVLKQHLRKTSLDTNTSALEVGPYDNEALYNQEQLCMIKSGAEFIMKMFKDFPCNVFRMERALIQDWLNDYRDKIYGVCLQKNICDIQLKEYISKIAHCHLNSSRYETCSINITRILQYSRGITTRQPCITGRNLMISDDLNIDSLIQEFQNGGQSFVADEHSSDHARYVLIQHLRHQIHSYIVSEQSKLFAPERNHFDRNVNSLSIYSVFDLLRLYGYTCLLTTEDNSQDLTSEEKRIRDSMAMEFVNVPNFADDVITACDNHLELTRKQRMPYTKSFNL